MAQITNQIMMVRPAQFRFNTQTAENNAFQSQEEDLSRKELSQKAVEEFDQMVETLRSKGIVVHVIQDTDEPVKPDAVFPNNWISFHENGAVITYPMYAPNRRVERREEIIEYIADHYDVQKRYAFEQYEDKDMFLEGTGSMLLDRDHEITYACISDRTDVRLLDKFCVLTGYTKVAFHSVDQNGDPIYHTNVMMALGKDFCVLVKESIHDEQELQLLLTSLEKTGKKVIDINYDQMSSFAGNMLQVRNEEGDDYLVMSQSAYDSLEIEQKAELAKLTTLLPIDITTIENTGGGSVRCMMAEIFLPKTPN